MSPSSLYIHVPFCARRCPYCDFAVSLQRRPEFREAYVEAVRCEIGGQLRGADATMRTIFCGGGTPTELSALQLNSLLDTVREFAVLAPDAEISLEGNPENLSPAMLAELREGGWNRLSLGAQAFDDETLRFLGRAHDGERIKQVVETARQTGWENISLDLMVGAPTQSLSSWEETLRQAGELGVPHVSAYSLTVENGTAFGMRESKGAACVVDDDALADRMDAASTILEGAGLQRYEVASWARPGWECRHNENYWRGGDYLAAGSGAHGHRSGFRWWNERDAKVYIRRMQCEGGAISGSEELDETARLVERIATGIRTREGFVLQPQELHTLAKPLETLRGAGLIQCDGGHIWANPSGFALADGLASCLIGHIL